MLGNVVVTKVQGKLSAKTFSKECLERIVCTIEQQRHSVPK